MYDQNAVETTTAFNQNPQLTSVGIHSATFLHLYVSDLTGAGSAISLAWWFKAKFITTCHEMLQTAS